MALSVAARRGRSPIWLGRKVALKLVHPDALGDQEAAERFLYEARTTAKPSHLPIGLGSHGALVARWQKPLRRCHNRL